MNDKSVSANYIYNLAFRVMAILLPLITTPYISRVLGAGNIGIYSYSDSLTGFFLMLATLGALSYADRETARVRENKWDRSVIFWEIVLFKFIAATLACLLFYFFLNLKKVENKTILLILSIQFLISATDLSWFLQGTEMFKQLSLRNMGVKILGVAMVFLMVRSEKDLPAYVLCAVLPGLIGNLLLWKNALQQVDRVPLRQLRVIRHLRPILVFFIPAVSVQIYHTVDKLMLQWIIRDNYENGYYDQAYKIITILLTVLTSYNGVMYSRMSNLFRHGDKEKIEAHISQAIPFVLMLGFPMVVGLAVIAERFVPVFFGSGYDQVVILLRLLSPMILITGLSNFVANVFLIPAGKQGKSNIAIIAGAVTNVICNLLLIPRLHALGACFATVISEIVILVFMCAFQKGVTRQLLKAMKKYLVAALLMGVITFMVDWLMPDALSVAQNTLVIACLVVVGVIVYFGALLVWKDNCVIELLPARLKKGH